MIDAAYCVQMARYNAWQNRQLKSALGALSRDDLMRDRGAFFGSIFATLNHLLWADGVWLSRLAGTARPDGGIAESVALTATLDAWEIARFRRDAEMVLWSERLRSVELTGMLSWYSGAEGRTVERPRAVCVMHMFNHQTHHRGQVHAMLSQAGVRAPVSDLAFMPDDARVL
ncbi:DinB family protein [Roseivivax jejudonensis]|uniref:DinB family protein n=1 Tax=Roseivivax jejudonensis TaxID=1529041 RepID=A0A1X6Z8G4_9RHOB|nr:DinB family protein [Roseivivax jejudonensis]SLN44031.1 DinB family protein [Roseivivax jejudonensis]